MKGHPNRPTSDSHYRGDRFAAELDGSLATVVEIPCAEDAVLHIQIAVTVADLTAFEVHAKAHADDNYVPVRTEASDYTSPTGMVLEAGRTGSSNDLTVTPSGETAWLRLDVSGIDSIKIMADGSGSVLTGSWGAN